MRIKATTILLTALLSLTLAISCDGPKGDDDDDDHGDGPGGGPGDGPGNLAICNASQTDECGTAVSQNLTATNKNIETVEDNMGPPAVGTLNINSGLYVTQADVLDSIKSSVAENLAGSARALDFVHSFINMAEPQIMNENGSLEGEIDMGFMTLSYKFETESKYELLTQGGENGDYYIKVDGTNYTLMRTDETEEHPGINLIEISYTDENNWTVLDKNTSDQCDNRPMVIVSYVERKDGVWYGKAQNYKPESDDCDPELTAGNDDYVFFVQFVGDEVAATASMYRIPMDFSSYDDLDDYDLGTTDATPSAPVNPVCLEKDKDPVAETACSSDNSDISTPNFLENSRWLMPSDLAEVWNTFPASL